MKKIAVLSLLLLAIPLDSPASLILDSTIQKVDARVRFAGQNQGGGVTTQTTGGVFDGHREGTFLSFDFVEAEQHSEVFTSGNGLTLTGTGFGRTVRNVGSGAKETYIGQSSMAVEFTTEVSSILYYDIGLVDAGDGHDTLFQVALLGAPILDLAGTVATAGQLALLGGETYTISIEAGGRRNTNSRHDLTSSFEVNISVVPAPMSTSLLGIGVLTLVVTRRRKAGRVLRGEKTST